MLKGPSPAQVDFVPADSVAEDRSRLPRTERCDGWLAAAACTEWERSDGAYLGLASTLLGTGAAVCAALIPPAALTAPIALSQKLALPLAENDQAHSPKTPRALL